MSANVSELVGVFGGTFDPVHIGHLRLAEEALEHLGLSRVLWIPAGRPPHREAPAVSDQQRLEMVRLAVAGNENFAVDATEVESSAPSYTVPTLERLRTADGQRTLVLLLGADAFAGLPGWHRWRDLFALAHIAVSHRPGFPIESSSLPPELAEEFLQRRVNDARQFANSQSGAIASFAMTQLAVSATQIRKLLANGKSARYLLPEAVIAYIRQQHIY